LFAFLVLSHGRRQLLWFEVTRHPTAEWLARQITEAFPWTSAPSYLVRDNDAAYGHVFTSRLRAMGIRDRPISPRSPWQNGYAERLIGTVRRECLDRMLIFGEAHLRRILSMYAIYYNESRSTYHCTRMRHCIEQSNGLVPSLSVCSVDRALAQSATARRFRHRILHPVCVHRHVHLRQLRPGATAAVDRPNAARICLFRVPAFGRHDAASRPRRSSLGYSTDSLEFFGIGWSWIATTLAAHSSRRLARHGVGRRWHVFRPGHCDRLRQPRRHRRSWIR
jgi:hypothetical protein